MFFFVVQPHDLALKIPEKKLMNIIGTHEIPRAVILLPPCFIWQAQLKRAIEEVSKGSVSPAKMPQGVSHRWVSLAESTRVFLARFDHIKFLYTNLKMAFPLAGKKEEVSERYSTGGVCFE